MSTPNSGTSSSPLKYRYVAAWRWHFYAGLFVVPFLLMLSVTGLIMVLNGPIDSLVYRDQVVVQPSGEALAPSAQVSSVQEAYPGSPVAAFIPAKRPDRSTQVSIVVPRAGGHMHGAPPGEATRTVFVDPYTATVLGSVDPAKTPEGWATTVHGTLLIGTTGDFLIEIAAGLSILLVMTGLYMWWPRSSGGGAFRLIPTLSAGGRLDWRNLHVSVGFWISAGLVFFMLSGLTWTSVWGDRFTQVWGTLPAERSTALPSDLTYAELNRAPLREVPWAMEQAFVPASGSEAGTPGLPEGSAIDVDAVARFAHATGFGHFRVLFPRGETGSWIIQATTMAGDVTDPREDRTLHIDQYSGRVLADVGFEDYPVLGKAMAAGVALHQGDAGVWNIVANVVFCLATITVAVSGTVMWWMRRPAGRPALAPPPLPRDVRTWKRAALLMFGLSLLFPLVAATLIGLWLVDVAVVSRFPALARAVK